MGFLRSFNSMAIAFFAIIFLAGALFQCDIGRQENKTIAQIQSGEQVNEMPIWARGMKLNNWQENFNSFMKGDILAFHKFLTETLEQRVYEQVPGKGEFAANKRDKAREKLIESAYARRSDRRKSLMGSFEGLFLINDLKFKSTSKGETLHVTLGLIGSGTEFKFSTAISGDFKSIVDYENLDTNMDWSDLDEGQFVFFAGSFAPQRSPSATIRKSGHTCNWNERPIWATCEVFNPKVLGLLREKGSFGKENPPSATKRQIPGL